MLCGNRNGWKLCTRKFGHKGSHLNHGTPIKGGFSYSSWNDEEGTFYMENPNTWTQIEHIIQKQIEIHNKEIQNNMPGLSLPKKISKALKTNSLLKEPKEYKIHIFDDGTIWYMNKEGRWHREDGPAIVKADGTQEYYLNGEKVSKESLNLGKTNKPL